MKIALLFPGQGSQYVGMGKHLYVNFSEAKEIFDEACEVLSYDIKKLCFESSMEELTQTRNTQIAILTSSVAAFKVYMKEYGVEPIISAGHSLGEFSALVCADSIQFSDCLKIVQKRGRLMEEIKLQEPCAMYAVTGISSSLVEEEYLRQEAQSLGIYISNYNSKEQLVISGYETSLQKFSIDLEKLGAKLTKLKVSSAFHTPLMEKAAIGLNSELSKYEYRNPKWPVISNVTAMPYKDKGEIALLLTKQLVSPVRWSSSIEYMKKVDVKIAIELGPKHVLKNLLNKNSPDIKGFAYDVMEDKNNLWRQFFENNPVTECVAEAICTRNRNWDNEEYENGVVEPLKALRELQENLETEKRIPGELEIKKARELLTKIFNTKLLPKDEQECRLKAIFEK